jgi:uncharacterized repeat protein (TIGR02543 family)
LIGGGEFVADGAFSKLPTPEEVNAEGSSITKNNYVFTGWTSNKGESYANGDPLLKSDDGLTLYGQWEAIDDAYYRV